MSGKKHPKETSYAKGMQEKWYMPTPTDPMPLQETHRKRKPEYTVDCRWDILPQTDPHG